VYTVHRTHTSGCIDSETAQTEAEAVVEAVGVERGRWREGEKEDRTQGHKEKRRRGEEEKKKEKEKKKKKKKRPLA
jgi:hypothetical protein